MEWAKSKSIGRVTEMTLLTPIKPGLIPGERRTYEQRLAGVLDFVQRRVERGIPTPVGVMPTIHFARWLILRPRQYLQYSSTAPAVDHRSWLFFTSNFDGDMKDYLREFSVFLGDDVDRIWGNCEGWPAGGSRDFEKFWDYAKQHQIPTRVFYTAYPDLTVVRIHQLRRFKRAFDAFVARTRRPDGRTIEELAKLFDAFLEANTIYPNEFPREGGTYVDGQP